MRTRAYRSMQPSGISGGSLVLHAGRDMPAPPHVVTTMYLYEFGSIKHLKPYDSNVSLAAVERRYAR